MPDSYKLYAFIAVCIVLVAFCAFMWHFSKRRGFNPWCWVASGILGLIVLPFLPNPKAAATPEESLLRAKRGNMTGLLLTASLVIVKIAGRFFRDGHH